MTFTLISPSILEGIGVIGFFIYVANYGFLTLKWLSSDSIAFLMFNLVAASCVLIGLTNSFNLASALIQVFWVLMSVLAIAIRLRRPVLT